LEGLGSKKKLFHEFYDLFKDVASEWIGDEADSRLGDSME
jgi:hypothetical protein